MAPRFGALLVSGALTSPRLGARRGRPYVGLRGDRASGEPAFNGGLRDQNPARARLDCVELPGADCAVDLIAAAPASDGRLFSG